MFATVSKSDCSHARELLFGVCLIGVFSWLDDDVLELEHWAESVSCALVMVFPWLCHFHSYHLLVCDVCKAPMLAFSSESSRLCAFCSCTTLRLLSARDCRRV